MITHLFTTPQNTTSLRGGRRRGNPELKTNGRQAIQHFYRSRLIRPCLTAVTQAGPELKASATLSRWCLDRSIQGSLC